jgi:hypothetical protein
MHILIPIAAIILAGAVGGVINALIADEGLFGPRIEVVKGITIWRPGFFANLFFGAVAAFVSWAVYGPVAEMNILDGARAPTLTLATIGGAVLIGLSGARWLKTEVDKKQLSVAVVRAAAAPADQNMAAAMQTASPAEKLKLALGAEEPAS